MQPVAGEPVEIRALADPAVVSVTAVLAGDGHEATVELEHVDADDLYRADAAGDGHLAAASGARPEIGERRIWRTVVEAPPAALRYRLVAADHTTTLGSTAP